MMKTTRMFILLFIASNLLGCGGPTEHHEPAKEALSSGPEPFYNDVIVPVFDMPDYGSVPTLSFEEQDVVGLEASASSQINRSDRHFRDGNHALEWQWDSERSALRIEIPVPYKPKFRAPSSSADSVSVFGAWLYNETALPGKYLRVGFGRASSEDCHFEFGLDFTGWRFMCVKFDDMTGNPHPEMDVITLQSPQGIERRRLWLDQLQPVFFDDVRWQWPDYQMSFIESRVLNELYINTPEAREMQSRPVPDASKPHIRALTEDLIADYARGTFSEKHYLAEVDYFQTLHISKTPERIQGQMLDDIRSYFDHLLQIAVLHRQAEGDRQRELKRMYLLMTETLLDQGWAEGSSLNAQHHFGYKSRSWAPAVLLMAKTLREYDLLDPMMRSILWFGRDFLDYTQPFESYSEETRSSLANRMADYLNTFANSHLIVLLLLDDTAFKDYALQNFSEMLSQSIAWDNGALKPDGSFYHHGFHYAGYAVPAMSGMASVVHRLDGTPYEIEPEAYQRLKKVLLAAEKWGNPFWAFNACGRHPITGSIEGLKDSYKKVAQSVPDTDEADPELTALQDLVPGTELSQGFWVMNYAATGVHKWKDHHVLLKGYGPGVRSHETYGKDNRFGRYGSHGTMMLFQNGDPNISGIRYDGWDWSQPPGATTLQLPFDVLEGSAEGFYGWRPPQEAFFSGAGHLDNKYGAFAFALNSQSHEQSLQVRKSAFALGNTLICLGSDITNSSTNYPTVTTLFQWGGDDPQVQLSSALPLSGDQKCADLTKRPFWIIDPQSHGFLLPMGNDELVVQRRLQDSLHDKTKEKTQGLFAKAWLNHGVAPDAAGYEYIVKLSAESETLNRSKRFYEILAKNRTCHAIRIPSTKVSCHVFFETPSSVNPETIKTGDLLSTDTPVIVVSQKEETGRIRLAVTYPDPSSKRPYALQEPDHVVELRLKGVFQATPGETAPETRIENGSTVLRLILRGSKANRVELQPAPMNPHTSVGRPKT